MNCGIGDLTRGCGGRHQLLLLRFPCPQKRLDCWHDLRRLAGYRRDRISVRRPLWRFPWAPWFHAFARFCHSPCDGVAVQLVSARCSGTVTSRSVVLLPSRDGQSRRARCDDGWRSGRRVLRAVRQSALFLSMDSDPSVADRSNPIFLGARAARPRIGIRVDLDSDVPARTHFNRRSPDRTPRSKSSVRAQLTAAFGCGLLLG